jgi:7-cyano-7-deazaguanine synthase in queuosine biosynthesis
MPMADVVVVIDGCAQVTGGDVRSIRTRDIGGNAANWSLRTDRLVVGLPSTLTDRQMDWLEIHSAIFAADRSVDRAPHLNWTRSIDLHIPVREPEFWRRHVAAFQDIFSSLTYDRLHLTFHDGDHFSEPPRTRVEPFPDSDAVALLSGGLDSFVGALELLNGGAKPLFVAATGSGAVGRSQREVFEVLDSVDPTRELLKLTAQKRGHFPGDERSQRSRSFLFASSAALVASALEIENVYVNENGVMAVHVPLTAARIGSLSTRTASPRVLAQMGELATSALGATIRIKNLLVGMTKPDVVERGVDLGHADDLQRSVSCWSISHRSTHCGYCAPCLIRRISCVVHGVPDVVYDEDVFTDRAALSRDDAKDALTHLIELAEDFRDSDDTNLALDYPELLGGGLGLTLNDAIAMYRRWSRQALDLLGQEPVPAEFIT